VDQEGENDGDEQGGWKVGRQIGRPSRLSSTVVAAATRKGLSISINVTVTLCVQFSVHPENLRDQLHYKYTSEAAKKQSCCRGD
jgi:hypothetical protein